MILGKIRQVLMGAATARHLLVLVSFAFVCSMLGCQPKQANVLELSGETMGTTYSIKLIELVDSTAGAGHPEPEDLKRTIDSGLQAFNLVMSTYLPDSEVSRLNRAPVGEAIKVSASLFDVLHLSQEISGSSTGAFDVTVGPLVNLWGFGPSVKPGCGFAAASVGVTKESSCVPKDRDIQRVLATLGYDKLSLNKATLEVIKLADIQIDLSAIAKGYGVDHVAQLLKANGYDNFMVEIGGELYLSGVKTGGVPWIIGVVTPHTLQNTPAQAVKLSDLGMATSGDYRNYYEVNGVRHSHTIDPSTGRPVTHNLASVTVIAKTSAEADAYATAFSVMGGDKTMALAKSLELAVYLIEREADGYSARYSEAFAPYIHNIEH